MNKTTQIHKFYTSIKANGETLDLTCYMDTDNWRIANVSWHGQDVTNLLGCVSAVPTAAIRGLVSIDILSKERKTFEIKFDNPFPVCPPAVGMFDEWLCN